MKTTKFDKLKEFCLSRSAFSFGAMNRHFGLQTSALSSYSTYLNYLVQSGYVRKKNGVYSVPDKKRLKYCSIKDVKQYMFNNINRRLLADRDDELETWQRVAHMNKEEAEKQYKRAEALDKGFEAANKVNAEHLQVQFQKDQRIEALENQVGFYQEQVRQYRAKIDGTLWRRFKRLFA